MSPSPLVSAEPDSSRSGAVVQAGRSATACLSDDDVTLLLAPSTALEGAAGIDEHLATCPDCRDLVIVALHVTEREPARSLRAPARCTLFEPGRIVAERYCIKRLLGRGGMGEVYEALDLVERVCVALKTVKATACDQPHATARLLSELRAGRRVRHPNVCRLLDHHRHASLTAGNADLHFFTMQLLHGQTLRQRVQSAGPFCVEQAVEVARSILSGLAAIHDARIVHRDLKSDNVMLEQRGREQRVTIIDFGLARRTHAVKAVSPAASSGLSGSLGYMAPEQVLGKRVGPEADVFSFGVVMFEALTGRLPFDGLEGSSVTFVARQLCPRVLGLRDIVRHAPPELDRFLGRCLAMQPAERFADGRRALHELAALLGEPLCAAGSRQVVATRAG